MKRRTVRRLSLFGLLAVVVSLIQLAGGATPASADHGASRTVVNTIPQVSSYGETVLLRATVYDNSTSCDVLAISGCDRPTGRVYFYLMENGQATTLLGSAGHFWPLLVKDYSEFELNYCCLPVGSHTIAGFYIADAGGNHFDPSSGVTSHRVEKARPTAAVSQSAATTTLGQLVTFTATVTGVAGAAVPTGTVHFMEGSTAFGGPVTLVGGSASLTTSSLAPGTHLIWVAYAGDANYSYDQSPDVIHSVQPSATTTSLTSSPNPSTYGQSVLLQATVTGGATPTGSVSFMDGPNTLGIVALAGGTAQLSVSSLVVGTHGLSVVYNGDATHAGGSSAVLTHNVQQVPTLVALVSSPEPSFPDQTVTLQATVDPPAATGTVTFRDGATVLGTSAVAGGTATLTTSALGAGTHSLTAAYNGDATHASHTSPVRTHTVLRHPTSTALVSDVNPTVANQPATFRATVSTTGTPTGTVTFKDGTATLGTTPVVGGVATFTTSTLGAGSHPITATYSGDAVHAPSTSPALAHTVRACTIMAAPAGQTTFGTAANDVICGSAAADSIVGLGGDDVIVGFGGNDTMVGGDGVDRLMGGAGNDRLTGDAGGDYAVGADGTDTCSAESVATCEDPDLG